VRLADLHLRLPAAPSLLPAPSSSGAVLLIVRRVPVRLGARSYAVHIAPQGAALVASHLERERRPLFVVTDMHVAAKVWPRVEAALRRRGTAVPAPIVLRAGEASKSWRTLSAVHAALLRRGLDRSGCVVAVGGGVVLDVAGFAAATYMRGVDWIAVPTTLLAMVDAAVGGKTGIDLAGAKNIVGAFHQPRAVLAGTDFLVTLPPRQRRSGLAEVVKYAMIADRRLFTTLERQAAAWRHPRPLADARLVERCCALKAHVVAADERDAGQRAVLNFGHTVGHALEGDGRNGLVHGEAVGLGMLVATALSVAARRSRPEELRRLHRLLHRLGLPVVAPRRLRAADVRRRLRYDKKARGGVPRFVLTRGIGTASVDHHVSEERLLQALRTIFESLPPSSQRTS
jgi:3-dehydroquinate synthase